MRKKILYTLTTLLLQQLATGQKLLELKSYDTTVYVYTLDREQVDFLAERNTIIDTAFLFAHLYQKFSRNSNYAASLPPGNYITASISHAIVSYQFVQRFSFEIKQKVIDNDVILFIKDKKTRQNVADARVKILDADVPFNDGYGGYAFDKNSISRESLSKNKVFLRVSVGDEYCVMRYSYFPAYAPRGSGKRSRTYGRIFASSGYFINDKPVYRPGDTLRLKAFLVNPRTGRPFKRHANLTISEPAQSFTYTKKLKAVSAGAFTYDWQIPDTLRIDRNFQMEFRYKIRSNTFFKSSSFYLENYALSANRYEASLLKEEFYPGEDLCFRVRASDANGFPLQGTMIHYRLSLNSVQEFHGDSLTISAAKRLNFFENDTVYPYENSLEIKIPSGVLPQVDASYGIAVTLTDPVTFEQKVVQLSCNKLMKREQLLAFQKDDSLHVRYLFNGRDSARIYEVITLGGGDTLSKRRITTPGVFQLSPFSTQVVVKDEHNNATFVSVGFNRLEISKVKGERKADSVRISFSFPFDEAIHYRIYKKDKLVQQGRTKKLDFKIADNTKDPYSLLFTSNINNAIENNFYRITYVPPLHKIQLQSNLPAQAFPGQHLVVSVKATDCYNKPLRKLNLAAYAVNSQFNERLTIPEMSVPEPFKDLVTVQEVGNRDQVGIQEINLQVQKQLKGHHFARFDLYHNEFYQLRYPKGGQTILSKHIQSEVPEFALCVTSKNVAYTPKYILLDGQPVYISDLDGFPYSFQAAPGVHRVTFRYFNKRVTFNNVSFEPGNKYWLGFNMDTIRRSSGNIVLEDSLTTAQPDNREKDLLYNSLLLTNHFIYDSISIKTADGIILATSRARQGIKSLNVDGDYFYVYGPMRAASEATVRVNKKVFNLKVSAEYAHYFDHKIQAFISKHRGPVKGAIFGFTELPLGDHQLTHLKVPDVITPQPEKVHMTIDPRAGQTVSREPEYPQNYNPGGTGQFSIYFRSDEKIGLVKALWVISKNNPEESSFSQISHHYNMNAFTKNGSDGLYDLYFLMSSQQMFVLRNITLRNGDAFYVDPGAFKSEEISPEKLATPIKIYRDITRLPLLPFYFPPEQSAESIKESATMKRKDTYLHGFITDESLHPIPNVIVMAEVNGKFKYGALTNNVGEFEILDMLPGTYQLKLYHSSYQMKVFESRFFRVGNTYELNTALKSINWQKPVVETVRQDFRFMAFDDKKRANTMKLALYDKDTREPLRDFTLKVYEENSDVVEKTVTSEEDPEVGFPSQEKVYRLEIACRGYATVVFHNVRFIRDGFYALYLFMVSEKENPYVRTKEYDLQMQYYPETGNIASLASHYNAYHDVPLLDPDTKSGAYITREEYQSLASKDISSALATQAGVLGETVLQIGRAAAPKRLEAVEVSEPVLALPPARDRYASDELIYQVANNSDLSITRKRFSDVGFWQPNHITDKRGQVTFEIRLPDNITTWRTNILAMGKNHLHGLDTGEIRTYKPLQVSNVVPSYLWLGDKVWTKAKYANLTAAAKSISMSIEIDGKVVRQGRAIVKSDYVDSVLVDHRLPGPLQIKAALQFEEKYKDEELREVMVYDPAFRFHSNQRINMDADSTYRIHFEKETKGEIIFNNSLYERIVEEINQMQVNEYASVEQMSSLLNILLCKEKINRTLELKENLIPQIHRLLRQIENAQNKDGTWGWWKRQPANWRMTIYVVEALGKANRSGYYNRSFREGINAIKKNFNSLSAGDQVYAYWILVQLGEAELQMKKIIQGIDPEAFLPVDKMYYYKIREAAGDSVDPGDIYAVYLELNKQLPKIYYGDFFYEPRANLFTAYDLFSASALGKEWLQVFKGRLINGSLENNLNTYSKASLIEALTASAENTGHKPVTAEVIVNDSVKIKRFPYRLPISTAGYQLKHRGGSVFVNTAEERSTGKPEPRDSLFKISTSFVQYGIKTTELRAGVSCQMRVDIDAYRSFDYVMIEIPVPSGMRFVSKPQQGNYITEYYNNKVVVIFQRLNMMQVLLSFEMIPTFRGSFVWPAAKSSLVYYPYLYGNNRIQTIHIK